MAKGRKIAKWTLIVLLSIILLAFGVVFVSRIVVQTQTTMKKMSSLDERIYMPLGRQLQFVSIRGEKISNPVAIYLHGGPGTPTSFVDHVWQTGLTDKYTLISWDQRGSGRTYYENEERDPNNESVNMDQLLEDLDELVDWARDRFFENEVILIGHSWGTILGTHYAALHPEKVSHVVSIGQAVTDMGEEVAYTEARKRALDAGGDVDGMDAAFKAWQDSDGSMESLQALREETAGYLESEKALSTMEQVWMGLSSPYMFLRDAKWLFSELDMESFFRLNANLFSYVGDFDEREAIRKLDVPISFISGSDDWITPVSLVEDYMEKLDAPYKTLTTIPGCGHSPQFEDPEAFAEAFENAIKGAK